MMTRQQSRWIDRKGHPPITAMQSRLADLRERKGEAGVRQALSNLSPHPRGKPRKAGSEVRSSIWPEGKVAKPGRMG